MKIVNIFANKLFAFHYENYSDNEYDRLMELWTNVDFLKIYAQNNNIEDVQTFVNDVLNDAEQIQDFLDDIEQNNHPYGFFFEPLKDSEKYKTLALQKGKIRRNTLRYYAIKMNQNCYVITGGAIKMSQTMQGHQDTFIELTKLIKARTYFNQRGIINEDSFHELLIEQL